MNYSLFTRITIIYSLLILLTLFNNCTKTTEKTVISKPPVEKSVTEVVSRLGINLLKSDTLNAKQVKLITLKIYDRLKSIKGSDFIAFKEHDRSKITVNHQLTGTVNRMESGYSLNVKVTSDLNGEAVYNRTSVVNEEIELDFIINDIAERVVGKLW